MSSEPWPCVPLTEVTSFAGGVAFPKREQGRAAGKFPFYKVSDMNLPGNSPRLRQAANWIDDAQRRDLGARIWPAGTVVFPKVGAALKTEKRRLLTVDSAFDNNIMGLIPAEDKLSPGFLLAFMETIRLGDLAQEGAVPSINQRSIGRVEIPLPPLPMQTRIVDLLNSAAGVVAAAKAQSAKLERLFSSGLSQVFSAFSKAEHVRLDELASVERGISWKKTQESRFPEDAALPMVRIGNVQVSGIDMDDRLYVSGIDSGRCADRLITPQTILMIGSNGNPKRVGNAFLATPEIGGHGYASFLIGITAREPESTRYIWRYLQSPQVQHAITQATAGSTGLKNLSLKWLRGMRVPWPGMRDAVGAVAGMDLVDDTLRGTWRAEQKAAALKRGLTHALIGASHEIPDSYDKFLPRYLT